MITMHASTTYAVIYRSWKYIPILEHHGALNAPTRMLLSSRLLLPGSYVMGFKDTSSARLKQPLILESNTDDRWICETPSSSSAQYLLVVQHQISKACFGSFIRLLRLTKVMTTGWQKTCADRKNMTLCLKWWDLNVSDFCCFHPHKGCDVCCSPYYALDRDAAKLLWIRAMQYCDSGFIFKFTSENGYINFLEIRLPKYVPDGRSRNLLFYSTAQATQENPHFNSHSHWGQANSHIDWSK